MPQYFVRETFFRPDEQHREVSALPADLINGLRLLLVTRLFCVALVYGMRTSHSSLLQGVFTKHQVVRRRKSILESSPKSHFSGEAPRSRA